MNKRFAYFLPALVFPFAATTHADPAQLKCGANQDRVWVYDSLTDLNVAAKLKCNETVEIVSRVKGYVQIRALDGTSGYVPEAAFPGLPPLPEAAGDQPAGASALVKAAAAARAASVTVAAIAPPATKIEVPVQPSPVPVVIALSAPQPAAAPAAPTAPAIVPVASRPVVASKNAPSVVAPAVAVPTNAPVSLAASAPASVAAPPPPTVAVRTETPAVVAQANHGASSGAKQTKHDNAAPARSNAKPPAQVAVAAAPATPAPKAVAEPAPAITQAKMDVNPAIVSNGLTAPRLKTAVEESEDYPDAQPENESADAACHVYFSAYGLSPSQYKWMAANRKKQYPNVCPAPNLQSVDFVILFTHDSDTYTGAMPEPVHTDHSGFSDFNPLTTVDSALLSGADADKAHREYVWVFQMKRGAFDPVKFSPRRRPQFTTVESKGSGRAIEDAFNYVQEQGATQVAANQ